MNRLQLIKSALLLSIFIISHNASAQPAGWQYRMPITIYENSGVTLTDHQVPIRVNTQALIAAGEMEANGNDIRFATSCSGGSLEYWIEDYINTDTTKIWVKIPSIPANDSLGIMMYW